MACHTRAARSEPTPPRPLTTRETVMTPTPASLATSRIVGRPPPAWPGLGSFPNRGLQSVGGLSRSADDPAYPYRFGCRGLTARLHPAYGQATPKVTLPNHRSAGAVASWWPAQS